MAHCQIALFFSAVILIGGLFESVHGGYHVSSITDKIEHFIKTKNLTCENYKEYCAKKGEEAKNLSKNEHIEIYASPADFVANCETMLSAFVCDIDDYEKD